MSKRTEKQNARGAMKAKLRTLFHVLTPEDFDKQKHKLRREFKAKFPNKGASK